MSLQGIRVIYKIAYILDTSKCLHVNAFYSNWSFPEARVRIVAFRNGGSRKHVYAFVWVLSGFDCRRPPPTNFNQKGLDFIFFVGMAETQPKVS